MKDDNDSAEPAASSVAALDLLRLAQFRGDKQFEDRGRKTLDAFAPPGLVPPDEPAVQIALDAFEQVFRRRPLLARSGGMLPIVPALADRGIPTVLTGIALPESNIHSPNERLLLEYLPLGVDVARELFTRLASLG